MDGIGAGELGNPDDLVDRQIAFDRPEIALEMRAAADLVGFVRLETVQRELVFLCPDRNCLDAKFVCSAKYADGNFGSIGDQDLGNGQGRLL